MSYLNVYNHNIRTTSASAFTLYITIPALVYPYMYPCTVYKV